MCRSLWESYKVQWGVLGTHSAPQSLHRNQSVVRDGLLQPLRLPESGN